MEKKGFNYIADFHTHTTYSHGKGTVRDNIQRAVDIGLEKIAITDHGRDHFIFGVSDKNLSRQIDEVEGLRKDFDGIEIMCGIEANLKGMAGKIDVCPELLSRLDILLCGFHKPVWGAKISDYFKVYYNGYSHYIYKPTKGQLRRNTAAYVNLIKNNPIDILTHPNFHLKVDVKEICKVCSDYGTVLELSSRHDDLSDIELGHVALSGVNVAVNSDAHKIENIAGCDKALDNIIKYGISPSRVVNLDACRGFVFRSKR